MPVTVVTAAIPPPGFVVIETSRTRGCDAHPAFEPARRAHHERLFVVKHEHSFAVNPRPRAALSAESERVFAPNGCSCYRFPMSDLTPRQRQVLEFIDQEVRERGYPPSVREIGEAVGLSSSSTVHAHLAALQDKGYLRRDPTKPRALELHFESSSGAALDRRPVRHVPLVGEVAAGTGVLAHENIEDTVPMPEDFTGTGELFMLRVRGESMIEAGILDGDYVVVRQQPTAEAGEIVVAGIPGEEATVKTFLRRRGKIVLRPSNPAMDDLVFDPEEVTVFGKVVSLLRRF
jgi:repressor LexA